LKVRPRGRSAGTLTPPLPQVATVAKQVAAREYVSVPEGTTPHECNSQRHFFTFTGGASFAVYAPKHDVRLYLDLLQPTPHCALISSGLPVPTRLHHSVSALGCCRYDAMSVHAE